MTAALLPRPREPRCVCGHSASSHRIGLDRCGCDGGDRSLTVHDWRSTCEGQPGVGRSCLFYWPPGGFGGEEWQAYKVRRDAWRSQQAALGWPRRRS